MIIFMDGFDYLTVVNGVQKWTTMSGGLATGIYGRGKGLLCNAGVSKTLPANFVTGFQAFHLFTGSAFPSATGTICRFLDAATIQTDLRIDNVGRLFFTRNGTTIGSVGTTPLVLNQWYWLEVKVKIDPAAGEASVQINGSAYLTQTGLNTRSTANTFFNQVSVILNWSGNQTQIVDSYHFFDATAGSGNDPSNFFGEHTIETSLGTADGSNLAWQKFPNTTTHVSKVNEANHDGDTTYVFDITPGDIDSYTFAALPVAGAIAMVAINTIDRADDGMTHAIQHYTKSGAATALSASFTPAANYQNDQSLRPVDPNTSAAWTVAARNAAEFGQKFIS